ncbi:MAG: YeeE/YedE family protein [Paracoccaceae bacterium]
MPVTEFTPFAALMGGVLIGLSAVLMMLVSGRIAGISGIAAQMAPPYRDGALAERISFIAGIIVAPLLISLVSGTVPPMSMVSGTGLLIGAGLLVGYGSVWGGGCTSGHGVCGLARLSPRSFVAVPVFMAAAMATVYVTRHLL